MKHLITIFLFLLFVFSANAQSQKYYQDLHGIRLKQFREVPTAEFGNPVKTGNFEDGFEYEFFLLKPDRSLYMVFEYSADLTDQIWSIQITGTEASADLGFENLRFGMGKAEVEKKFGKPTKTVDVGEHGERWEYVQSNFSFEINLQGKLSSIKIKDTPDDSLNTPEFKKTPKTTDVLKLITSEKNEDIARLLAADIEIYKGKETLFFRKSLKNEILTDSSKIFSTIRELSMDLKNIKANGSDEYEEHGRFTLGQAPKHVIKFKKGYKILEIVFKYQWGEFLIWEIKAL